MPFMKDPDKVIKSLMLEIDALNSAYMNLEELS